LFLINQDTKLLENQVYIQLRRKGFSPFFLKRKTEVDFYIPEEKLLIQVSYSIKEVETYEREIKGLQQAMKEFDISESYIITYNEEETITSDYGTIHIIPAWLWLLEGF
jgi:uncharacterized protein